MINEIVTTSAYFAPWGGFAAPRLRHRLAHLVILLARFTAGLPISYTWGLRHNFCCRGPILIPRPVLESPAQTTCVNVLVFL